MNGTNDGDEDGDGDEMIAVCRKHFLRINKKEDYLRIDASFHIRILKTILSVDFMVLP